MEINALLLDSNFYTAFKNGNSTAVTILEDVPLIVLNPVILGELLGGFAAGKREADNREQLDRFMSSPRVRLIEIDKDTAHYYARIYKSLRAAGTPIPTNDLWIAANALQHDLAVATYDKHFKHIPQLKIVTAPADIF